MKVGLIDIEPKIVNTAYMQIACYHRQRGDSVEWWTPLEHRQFDVVYCSSIFDFTDKSQIPEDVICGGTGSDVNSRLSRVIENSDYDYSIYPKCRKSYIWFSRGCIRKCPWCVVPAKEGKLKAVEPKNLNPDGEYIVICDNNFFANRRWKGAILWLSSKKQPLDFQGVDVRILNKSMCKALLGLRHFKRIKIAWDNPQEDLMPVIKKVTEWIPAYRLMCYVLIGYSSTPEEDLYRVETLRKSGIDPFVMPYNKKDLYQKAFARWVNHKAIFKKVKWEDYYKRVLKQEMNCCGWKK